MHEADGNPTQAPNPIAPARAHELSLSYAHDDD
jgi:hypothetical protein